MIADSKALPPTHQISLSTDLPRTLHAHVTYVLSGVVVFENLRSHPLFSSELLIPPPSEAHTGLMLNDVPGKATAEQLIQKISHQRLDDAIMKGRLLSARFVLKTNGLSYLQALHDAIGPMPTAQKADVICIV